MSIAKQNKW